MISPGGYIPGTVTLTLRRGPRVEGLGPDFLVIYEDECFINPKTMTCIRRDPGHLALVHREET